MARQRLGVRQSPAAFGREWSPTAAGHCRTPRPCGVRSVHGKNSRNWLFAHFTPDPLTRAETTRARHSTRSASAQPGTSSRTSSTRLIQTPSKRLLQCRRALWPHCPLQGSDLHPFLSYFAHVHFKAFTKTIRHTVSKKKEFGEWVHPDMVGVHYPLEDWSPEVLSLSTATGNTGLKLYSFELKKTLGFPNLREAFFQAVSNSPGPMKVTSQQQIFPTKTTFSPSCAVCPPLSESES